MSGIASAGTTSDKRHADELPTPIAMTPASSGGTPPCAAPAPALPQPALVALAVPTTLGANITDVWYWVMTKLAPTAPMPSRHSRKLSYPPDRAAPTTGNA